MSWTFESVAGPYTFTEGPVWDGEGVIFSDIPTDRIMRYDVREDECRTLYRDTNAANGLKLDTDGRLYACEMNGRCLARYDDGGRHEIVGSFDGHRFNSPNDLAIHDDWIWFTDPYYAADWEPADKQLELDHRSVYRLKPDDPESLARVTFDTTNPNGLVVSPDGSRLYVAQSDYEGPLELRAYPIEDGTLSEYELLHDFHPHRGIDGMCLDEEGNVVATAGWDEGGPGPSLYLFAPDGTVREKHHAPDPMPTNCCFGGDDLQTLYVTGSDGCLYRTTTDRTGYLGPPSR